MKNEDLLKAYLRWIDAWPMKTDGAWARFLGWPSGFADLPPDDNSFPSFLYEIPDIGAERVRMICSSPHWYALIRAMAVKEVEGVFDG